MLEALLPSTVVCEERFDDPPDAVLLQGEAEVVARAVERRRREFATARHCARLALGRLGLPPTPLLRAGSGEPRWPDGVVGSITHCEGYRAAAVARRAEVLAVGVDAEPHAPLPPEVAPLVLDGEERALVERLGQRLPGVHWDRLVFSAKESVFKVWYPRTGRWLDFADATVDVEPDGGVFHARLHVAAPHPLGDGIRGRWLVEGPLLLTAVTITAR